jgi:isopentenyl-diphosphate Delta-isomerase
MTTEEKVILVNEFDEEIGISEKYLAHREGKLHRAISVFVVNSHGDLLLQRRALSKYHSGGLWTNTCCSHPRPDEHVSQAAKRRLKEEMGIENCDLKFLFSFNYKAELDNDFIENELDHVFLGYSDSMPSPDNNEVCDWKYISLENIEKDIRINPSQYTYWFKLIFDKIKSIHGIN